VDRTRTLTVRGPPACRARRDGCNAGGPEMRERQRCGKRDAHGQGKRCRLQRRATCGGRGACASRLVVDLLHSVWQARSAEAKPNHAFFSCQQPWAEIFTPKRLAALHRLRATACRTTGEEAVAAILAFRVPAGHVRETPLNKHSAAPVQRACTVASQQHRTTRRSAAPCLTYPQRARFFFTRKRSRGEVQTRICAKKIGAGRCHQVQERTLCHVPRAVTGTRAKKNRPRGAVR